MFDDYEDYRLSQESFDDDDGSEGYSGDGCLYIVLLGIIFIILLSFF